MGESLTLPAGLSFPKTALEVSIDFDTHLQTSSRADYIPIPTGFPRLDELLGGGLHSESLMLVGGPPGAGKTIFALQTARNIAASGKASACMVCFEHSEVYLYHRLLCLESALSGDAESEGITLNDIRQVVMQYPSANLQTLLEHLPAARRSWEHLVKYWERLYLIKGHPAKSTINVLETYLSWLRKKSERLVLFVDYLQKVPVFVPGLEMTAERQIRIVTEGLKNIALTHRIPIVAVAASDAEGLKAGQVRFRDLWGGASIQYEPDVALMLNRGDRDRITFSIEKNRMGPTGAAFEQLLFGERFAFLPVVEL